MSLTDQPDSPQSVCMLIYMCLPSWPGPVLHLMLAGQKGIFPVSLCVGGFPGFGCSLAETSSLDY